MKKLYVILIPLMIFAVFSGCDDDVVYRERNYYDVTFNNIEYDKYITSIEIREVTHGQGQWGVNQLDDTIWGRESWTITLEEGVYDFRIQMEDSLYYYSATEYNVVVDGDVDLNICYECKDSHFTKEKKLVPDQNVFHPAAVIKIHPKKIFRGT